MHKASPENLLLVGKVIRPHGLGGLLRIWVYSRSEESFFTKGTIFLKADPEEFHRVRVVSITPHKNFFLMKLKELNSLEVAEKFRGAEIFIRKDELRGKEEDEYYWFELIGLEVFSTKGLLIGTLSDIIETGSNDVYVVRKGEKELLIPGIHDVVKEIDLDNKRMTINEMEGLFTLNEV